MAFVSGLSGAVDLELLLTYDLLAEPENRLGSR
jgi:hypothetical protein